MVSNTNFLDVMKSLMVLGLLPIRSLSLGVGHLPNCANLCFDQTSVHSSCAAITDLKCICHDQTFLNSLHSCFQMRCDANSLPTALKVMETCKEAFGVNMESPESNQKAAVTPPVVVYLDPHTGSNVATNGYPRVGSSVPPSVLGMNGYPATTAGASLPPSGQNPASQGQAQAQAPAPAFPQVIRPVATPEGTQSQTSAINQSENPPVAQSPTNVPQPVQKLSLNSTPGVNPATSQSMAQASAQNATSSSVLNFPSLSKSIPVAVTASFVTVLFL